MKFYILTNENTSPPSQLPLFNPAARMTAVGYRDRDRHQDPETETETGAGKELETEREMEI